MSDKLAVIHLGGESNGEVADYLLVRNPVTEGDEINGVKFFQNGVCHVTKIDFPTEVIFATGIIESGELVTCPIGQHLEWSVVKDFPVIYAALKRPYKSVCIDTERSEVIKITMKNILHSVRWARDTKFPAVWRPANDDEKRNRELAITYQEQK